LLIIIIIPLLKIEVHLIAIVIKAPLIQLIRT
jgi:hypothetical protein